VSDVAAWSAHLDALEAEARAAAALLPGGRRRPFVPPAQLGPLPAVLADRAREVLGALDAASRVAAAELARTAEQLALLARHDPRGPRPASALDVQA